MSRPTAPSPDAAEQTYRDYTARAAADARAAATIADATASQAEARAATAADRAARARAAIARDGINSPWALANSREKAAAEGEYNKLQWKASQLRKKANEAGAAAAAAEAALASLAPTGDVAAAPGQPSPAPVVEAAAKKETQMRADTAPFVSQAKAQDARAPRRPAGQVLVHTPSAAGQTAQAAALAATTSAAAPSTATGPLSPAPAVVRFAPTVVQPSPVVTQPVPTVAKPVPVVAKPVPTVAEPAPAVVQFAPVVTQPAPAVAKPAPAVAKPVPAAAQSAQSTAKPVPAVTQPAQAVVQFAPVVTQPAPVVAKPVPPVAEPAPTAAKPAQVVAKPTPVVSKPVPTVAEPTPAAEMEALQILMQQTARLAMSQAPTVAKPAPTVAKPASAVVQFAPVVTQSAPAVAKFAPVVAKPASAVAEPAPAAAGSVWARAAEAARLVVQQATSVAEPEPAVLKPAPAVAGTAWGRVVEAARLAAPPPPVVERPPPGWGVFDGELVRSPESFTVERVSVPQHWGILPVHNTLRAFAIQTSTIRSYFRVEKKLGSGMYGQVYAVRLTNPDSCSALAGLSASETYALKVQLVSPQPPRPTAKHSQLLADLETNILMRQVGMDMLHFVPLLAWTRWYVESDGISVFPSLYDKVHMQLILLPYVSGLTAADTYGLKQNKGLAPPHDLVELPTPHPLYVPVKDSPYSRDRRALRLFEHLSSIIVQFLCALHILRASGTDLYLHRDLHPGNIMFSTPAGERPPQFLLYSGTGTYVGTQKMFVVPLVLAGGRILRILDMGSSAVCYDYRNASSADGVGQHCTDYVKRMDDGVYADYNSVIGLFWKIVRRYIPEIQDEVEELAEREFQIARLGEDAPKLPDYYLRVLNFTGFVNESFSVDNEAELVDRLKTFGAVYYSDITHYTRALAEGRYRMVNMPMTVGHTILPVNPVND
jgi:serine/threonine protein kinase